MATALRDIEIDEYLAGCVQIVPEPEALEEEFVRLPADLAYWNEKLAQATRALLMAKLEHDRTAARLRLELRERMIVEAKTEAELEGARTGKKGTAKAPTVGDIDAAVECHPDSYKARLTEIEAEAEKVRAYGIVDAIRCKRDMVIQLGVRQRIELESDPVVRERVRQSRER